MCIESTLWWSCWSLCVGRWGSISGGRTLILHNMNRQQLNTPLFIFKYIAPFSLFFLRKILNYPSLIKTLNILYNQTFSLDLSLQIFHSILSHSNASTFSIFYKSILALKNPTLYTRPSPLQGIMSVIFFEIRIFFKLYFWNIKFVFKKQSFSNYLSI